MMRLTGVLLKAAALICCPIVAGCTLLQETVPGATLSDANVMTVLNSLGQGEIEAAKLAQEKATTSDVKAFAARVLNEHRELEQANGRLTEQLALEPQPSLLTSQLEQAHEDGMERLRATTGMAFDRAYVDFEIRQHVRAFRFIEAAAESEATP